MTINYLTSTQIFFTPFPKQAALPEEESYRLRANALPFPITPNPQSTAEENVEWARSLRFRTLSPEEATEALPLLLGSPASEHIVKELSEEEILTLTDKLIEQGGDFFQIYNPEEGTELTLMDFCVLSYLSNPLTSFYSKIIRKYANRGCLSPISSNFLNWMNPAKHEEHSSSFFFQQLEAWVHQDQIDAKSIAQAHRFKKDLKQWRVHYPQDADQAKQLIEIFRKQYNRAVESDPILTAVRGLSRAIRHPLPCPEGFNPVDPCYRINPILSLLGAHEPLSKGALSGIRGALTQHPTIWTNGLSDAVRLNLSQSAKLFEQDPSLRSLFDRKHFVWLHGTKSHSLPSILQDGALKTVRMMSPGQVPMNGELGGSHLKVAQELYGVLFSNRWYPPKDFTIFNSRTNSPIPFYYATKAKGYSDSYCFDPESTWKRLESSLKNPTEENKEEIRIDILRVRQTDATAIQKLFRLLPSREKWPPYIHEFLSVPTPFWSGEDRDLITQKPFPLVFACDASQAALSLRPLHYACLAQAPLHLGKEIQHVFTDPKHIEILGHHLNRKGIKNITVHPLSNLFYLEALFIERGGNFEKASLDLFEGIGFILREDIFPAYSQRFPEHPTYKDEKGEELPVPNPLFGWAKDGTRLPNWQAYSEAVEAGDIPARFIHGRSHAARVALFSCLLMPLFCKSGFTSGSHPTPQGLRLLLIAASCHDAARQDEGVDRWDKESAGFFKNWGQTQNFPESVTEHYVHAIAEKDPEDGVFTSIDQRIIHDADCFEILRCISRETFDPSKLCLVAEQIITPAQTEQLIEELHLFISFTETHKQEFEEFDNLLHYFFKLLLFNDRAFPFLCSLASANAQLPLTS